MQTEESKLQSWIESWLESGRLISLLIKAFVVLIGIMVSSIIIYFILQGEYKGIFYILFIVISTILVFRLYLKEMRIPSQLKPEPEPELMGNLDSMAAMIRRASEGLEYSQGALEKYLSGLRGEECHFEGKGDKYLASLKEFLEDI